MGLCHGRTDEAAGDGTDHAPGHRPAHGSARQAPNGGTGTGAQERSGADIALQS